MAWHDGMHRTEHISVMNVVFSKVLCLCSRAFENVYPRRGTNRPLTSVDMECETTTRESNHPCPAMTGDHPNPLRRRSKLLLRDPTALRLRHRVGNPQSGMAHTVIPALPAAIRLDHKLGHWSPSPSTLKKNLKAKRAVKSCLRPTSAANAPRFASYEDAPAPAGSNGRTSWNLDPLAPSAGTAIIQAAE